jgi:transcriptional regulator with XRE-family HTH domain
VPDDLPQRLGARVRGLRVDAGLTQQELADAAGVHRTYIAQIENGTRNVSVTAVGQVADGLGITLSELFATL